MNRDDIARAFDLRPDDLRRPDSFVAAAREARDQFEKRRDEIAAAAASLMPVIVVEAAMLTGIKLSEIADYEIDFDAGKRSTSR